MRVVVIYLQQRQHIVEAGARGEEFRNRLGHVRRHLFRRVHATLHLSLFHVETRLSTRSTLLLHPLHGSETD